MTRSPRHHQRSSRAGFTLIELLIVVVIIGILAAIAIPKFASTKEKSFVATMKSDLRSLVMAQEVYLADNGTYYIGGVPNAALKYQPSSNTTITIVGATPSGWSASASYVGTPKTCAMFYGNIAAVAPAVVAGEPKCT
jgi:prepilin-type N-terminal cleavage/methylation domain-containing protein